MAPSNMFSYLRPGHGKRNASTSNLASPDPSSTATPPPPSPSMHNPEYLTSPRIPDTASYTSGSPVSPYPPQLPPIPRVASRMDKKGQRPPATSPQHSNNGDARLASPHDRSHLSPMPLQRDQLSPGYDSLRPSSRSTTASSMTGLRSPGQSLAQVVEHAMHPETPPASSASLLSPSSISTNYAANSKSQTSLLSGISDKLSGNPKSSTTPNTVSGRTGKSRLNLRNPMSLLMRRRSGQTLDPLSDEAIVTHRSPSIVPPIPDNYDPSIRGRIVHDFSAPRPNRNFSYNNAYAEDQEQTSTNDGGEVGRQSPPKIEREHTPVFREHFDDDTSYEQSQAAIRAEKLANKNFVARNSWQPPPPGRSPPPPPPLPKDSPPIPPPEPTLTPPPIPEDKPTPFGSSILSPVQESFSPTDPPVEVSPRKRKSTKTPPAPRSRATSITDPSFTPAGLPTHLTSRSSRFSFQIAGTDNSQEKVLEDRHKQKAAEKASKEVRMSTNTFDDEYDEYGMDDFDDMDGGYEEEIPMLGDDDGFGDASMSPGMSAFDFSTLSMPYNNPMSPLGMVGDPQTPRDANGNIIGFALTEEMLQKMQLPAPGRHLHGASVPITEPRGLGIMDAQGGLVDQSHFTPVDTPEDLGTTVEDESPQKVDLGDDMYFDDGMIEEQGDVDAVEFDENVFDDPSGPLFDRNIKSPTKEELLHDALHSHPPIESSSDIGHEADDDVTRHLDKTEPSLAHKNSVANQKPSSDFSNINAYHSALADAATRAQADGRFTRKVSIDAGSSATYDIDEASSPSNSRPSLVPDDGRFSQDTTGFPPDDYMFDEMGSGFVDDYDYSEFDSALEDDPMIAAANAEALANDYDGFYGQEFGFYANAQGDATNAYGGFFGSSSLGRSVSGRNAVREPNLTPITERSEYSTRNSFISLHHFRDGQQPLQSPGLAQLARISPYGWREDDPDMSLDSLMKLRKGAFGGSTVSLGGSSTGNSPRNSSPMGMQYMPRNSSPLPLRPISHQGSSDLPESDDSGILDHGFDELAEDDDALDAVNAIPDDYSDEDDELDAARPESPTLTASDYNSLSSPTSLLGKDIPPFPGNLPLHPPSSSLPTHSPAPNIPLPSPPPLTVRTTFQSSFQPPAPHSIDTTYSSPPNSAPHRQSLGLISPISTTSPMTPGGSSGWKASHSRKGSAADSVAYVREHDEMGGDRWVLERRRTAESGELELIGREIIDRGCI